MKPLPTQKRALLKRAALIDAAVEEFSVVGFEAATAKSIALKAAVATGTFYQYFENKNEILRVIAIQRIDELKHKVGWYSLQDTNIRLTLEQVFKKNLETTYQFHSSSPELHQVLEQRRELDDKLSEIMDQGDALLYEEILKLVQSFNLEHPEVVAQNLFAMAEGIVHRHVFHQRGLNTEEVLSLGAKMLASYFK